MVSCKVVGLLGALPAGLGAIAGGNSSQAVYSDLANSLSHDNRFVDTLFVIRQSERDVSASGVYAFGEFAPVDMERFRHLAMQVSRVDRAARYIDYNEAERLTEILAHQLVERYGRKELLKFEYRPIPRGGVIVMGMLSYALGLPAGDVLSRESGSKRPVVFVDDCVLSGMRFKQQLKDLDNCKVILASLFAPEDLCGSSTAKKPSFDCVSAVRLKDLGPELYGAFYDSWRKQWADRLGDSVLWAGQPEYLCFAWNEPESSFLNSVTGEVEMGFRLAPPERCLHHRYINLSFSANGNVQSKKVQIHDDGPGPIDAAPGVVAARLDGNRVAVADFSKDQSKNSSGCYLLENSAADMWEQIIINGTIQKASKKLSLLYDTDYSTIASDMAVLIDSLVELGLIINA